MGGPIGLLRDGDIVAIDASKGALDVEVAPEELERRRGEWTPRPTFYGAGTLWKYAQTVGSAEKGAVTHPGGAAEAHVYADL